MVDCEPRPNTMKINTRRVRNVIQGVAVAWGLLGVPFGVMQLLDGNLFLALGVYISGALLVPLALMLWTIEPLKQWPVMQND